MRTTSTVVARPGVLKPARLAAGLSLRDVGSAAGVSKDTVHNVERGRVGIARDKADRLAEALGCNVGSLFVHGDGAPINVA